MEVWLQYTLDLSDKAKPEGTLVLGGWGTEDICYKFVAEKIYSHAGFNHGQELLEVGPEKVFPNEIQRAGWRCQKFSYTKRSVEKIYSDDFMYVYKVCETPGGKYNARTGEFEKNIPPTIVGLVLFIKTIPIHLPGALKGFLHDCLEGKTQCP